MDLRARFPLTLRHLGELPPAAAPGALVEAIGAAHARGDIPSRAVRDLARYEAMLHELEAAAPQGNGPLPGDGERVVLAKHARVLVYGAALPEMLAALREGKPARPRPSRGWLVLALDREGKIREHHLVREEGWLLESFRKPATPGEVIEDDEDRALFARLWREGILVRADQAAA